jgi:hypothetical protein
VTDHVTHTYYYVICRFKRTRPTGASISLSQHAPTTKRAVKSYDVAFKIIEYADHVEFHVTENQPTNHDHSLDESDANRSASRGRKGFTAVK